MPQPFVLQESVASARHSMTSLPVCLGECIEDRLQRLVPSIEMHPQPLHRAMHHAVFSGGKRIRPQLLVLIAGACGADLQAFDLALSAACAVELVHAASLVHDDLPCFDDAATRRGRPTVHVLCGTPMAVLTGDALLTLAFESLAGAAPLLADRALQVVRLLGRATGSASGLIGGQSMEQSLGTPCLTPALIERYQDMKTAALFQFACEAGAVVAGSAHTKDWAYVGQLMGRWYQLADDCLDLHGLPELAGKPVGQDAAHGRPNAMAYLGTNASLAKMRSLLCEIKSRITELCAVAATSPTPILGLLESLCEQIMRTIGAAHADK